MGFGLLIDYWVLDLARHGPLYLHLPYKSQEHSLNLLITQSQNLLPAMDDIEEQSFNLDSL